ncbi:DUF4175 domain-containing protein [Dongia soli]|uniref:DUF4175 family protein n=1 Tax=Dongia soli TaxID=600628 RepID=A0ABU5E4R1_9PROT|nr:DUF4175 family protein [Dongia soli]MDY0881251.1 DUF4175 family protein [Dongia soli]
MMQRQAEPQDRDRQSGGPEARAGGPHAVLPGHVRPYLWLARAFLILERLAPLSLTLVFILGIFLTAALFGLFRYLPAWLHATLLAAAFLTLVGTGWLQLRRFTWPGREAAIRRLERDSNLPHRPLTHLNDALSAGKDDPGLAALWAQHRARLLAAIGRLRVAPPRGDWSSRDPYALRGLLLLLLVIAIIGAGDLWPRRLLQALTPNFAGYASSEKVTVEAWITPPEYTGLPPISLTTGSAAGDAILSVPTGSKLLVQAEGVGAKAVLTANNQSSDFRMLDPLTQRIETKLTEGNGIGIRAAGSTLADWHIRIVADRPPTAEFAGNPSATDRGVLRLEYRASDDYGVKDLRAFIQRDGQTIETSLPLQSSDSKKATGSSYLDLTSHPWAGLPVEMRLVARDALGQIGATAPIALTLPERQFFHPVARALIAARKQLTEARLDDRKGLLAIARELFTIGEQPETYDHNLAAYLAINLAWRQLIDSLGIDQTGRENLQQLLWDTALAIEDGGTSLAMRDLRRLQRELEDALARNASPEEIEALMNKLQQAMNQYLQNLQQQLQRAVEKGLKLGPVNPNSTRLTQQDLNDMLNNARRMAQNGAKESAQQMLNRLQQMLENLQAGMPSMSAGNGQNQQMMNDLGRIMQQQQKLLEQTFRMQRDQNGQGGQGQEGDSGMSAADQEALRHQLGKLMQDVGNATGNLPQGLGQAEQAMRGAGEAFREGDLDSAANSQNEALSHLQQGLGQLGQMLSQKSGGQQTGPGKRDRMDPFGRAAPGSEDSGSNATETTGVKVPDQDPAQRSRQIFEELRQRRNDPSRPKLERDYIDRLLRQF